MWCHHILLSDIILNKSHVDLDLSFNLWFNNKSICASYMKFEVSLSKIFFKKTNFLSCLRFSKFFIYDRHQIKQRSQAEGWLTMHSFCQCSRFKRTMEFIKIWLKQLQATVSVVPSIETTNAYLARWFNTDQCGSNKSTQSTLLRLVSTSNNVVLFLVSDFRVRSIISH